MTSESPKYYDRLFLETVGEFKRPPVSETFDRRRQPTYLSTAARRVLRRFIDQQVTPRELMADVMLWTDRPMPAVWFWSIPKAACTSWEELVVELATTAIVARIKTEYSELALLSLQRAEAHRSQSGSG